MSGSVLSAFQGSGLKPEKVLAMLQQAWRSMQLLRAGPALCLSGDSLDVHHVFRSDYSAIDASVRTRDTSGKAIRARLISFRRCRRSAGALSVAQAGAGSIGTESPDGCYDQ